MLLMHKAMTEALMATSEQSQYERTVRISRTGMEVFYGEMLKDNNGYGPIKCSYPLMFHGCKVESDSKLKGFDVQVWARLEYERRG